MNVEVTVNGKKVSTIDELIAHQGDIFYVDDVLGLAKMLDGTIRKTADLNPLLEQHGFTIMRDAHKFLAVGEVDSECSRCHQKLASSGVTPKGSKNGVLVPPSGR